MADILSQAEIDALLSALTDDVPKNDDKGSTQTSVSGSERAKNKQIKVYDFRRPSKFSKEQLHTIQAIHENFSRLITTYLSAHLRTVAQVNVTSVEQLTYEEVVGSLPNPTIMNILTLHPLEGNILLDLNPNLAFSLIDRLFGGTGQEMDKVRGLTDIERTVVDKIINGMLVHFAEAWDNIIQMTPKVEMMESNPQFAQIVSPSEMVVMITFELRIGESHGLMTMCIPYLTIETVAPKLNAHFWYGSKGKKATVEHLESLRKRIEMARVSMTAILGGSTVTVGELLDLSVGDVIQLESSTNNPIEMRVGSKTKFLGVPGVSGSRMALQITNITQEGDDENE